MRNFQRFNVRSGFSATAMFLLLMLTASYSASAQTINCGGVGGTIRSQIGIMIPQQGSATLLEANIYAPDAALQTAPCPLITMLPGGGAALTSVEWAAKLLAANGYVVVITKPEQAGSLLSNNTAARSGIDYMLSSANPYLSSTSTTQIGGAGWSLGGRIFVRTQAEDTRLKAIVVFDNLAVSETGDIGSPACTNDPGTIRTPRIPAMSQGSNSCADGRLADVKKNAFNHWRAAGVPSMQVNFRNSTHFWWAATATDTQHAISHYYTQAWFDRYLKNDLTATARLVSRTPTGAAIGTIISSSFRSGAFLDGYNCDDFLRSCSLTQPLPKSRADFDGDGKSDVSVYRNNTWFVNRSSNNSFYGIQFGVSTDKLAPADYDGDGKNDIAVFRENTGNPNKANFYILQSMTSTVRTVQFGQTGDLPNVVGDWDGDGKADVAVYRNGASGGQSFFFYRPSGTAGADFVAVPWGASGDKGLHGDFDGDGKADAAVFRPSNSSWYVLQSSNQMLYSAQWGLASDKPVVADYDGDGRDDIAVFRDGNWYVLRSGGTLTNIISYGQAGDIPVPGDYDGDGADDMAVYRGGNWYFNLTTTSNFRSTNFGINTDTAVPNAYLP